MDNPLSLLKKMFASPAAVPPSSIRDPRTFSPEDLGILKKIGVDRNALRDSLSFSTQINFERTNIYREVDRAVMHWLVGSAVELYADYATNYNQLQDASVWITSDSNKYTNNLTTMLESIGMEEKIFDWAWTAAAYGDLFIGIDGAPGIGIVNIDDSQHPSNISRVDYKGVLVGFYETPFEAGALEVTASDAKLIAPWEWIHIRVLGAKKKRPVYSDPSFSEFRTVHLMGPEVKQVTSKYGTSLLMNGLPVYKRLRLAEDSVLLARLTRGILKYVYKIKVDGMNVEAASSIIDEYMTILKHARALNTDPNNPNYDSKSNPMACLRGDSVLRLCNGKEVTISELVENKEEYISHHIWSINPNTLELEPTRILAASKTREYAKLIRVHLDNDKHIDCTPDHKFMLRDGTYKEAQYLDADESLMPFYSKVNSKNHEMPGYEMIYNPGTGSYMYAHRCTFTPKWEKGTCIHHCDFDKLNNDPDNLLKMTNKIHKRLHDENITPELIEARRQGLIKHYLMHVKSVGGVSTKGKTLEEIYGKERANEIKNKISKNQVAWLKGKNLDNCPQLVELAKQHSIRLKKFYKTEKGKEVLQRVSETRKRRIASGEIKVISGEDHPQYGKTWAELYTPEQIENRIKKITAANKARALVKNHKVVRVEWLTEREDTYDITVEKNHNFSLANGIFVHNSVEDLFIPVWGDVNDISIEEIGGKTDIRWIVDVEELRNQLASALRCPLSLLGGYVQEASGSLGAEAISQLDIRFARSSRRLQRAIIEGITRMCQIHLAYQNMDPDPRLFEVHMSETSTAEEQQLRDSLDTGIDVIDKFMGMIDSVGNFDKVELLDYFNLKLLKLGDLDIKSYLKDNLPPEGEEGGMPTGTGGGVPKPYTPPTGGEAITGEPGEEEMTIDEPKEKKKPLSKAGVLNEARRLVEKAEKKTKTNRGKITRNLDYIAALPVPEKTDIKGYKPGKEWTNLYESVKVKIGEKAEVPSSKKSKDSKDSEDGKESKSSKGSEETGLVE